MDSDDESDSGGAARTQELGRGKRIKKVGEMPVYASLGRTIGSPKCTVLVHQGDAINRFV